MHWGRPGRLEQDSAPRTQPGTHHSCTPRSCCALGHGKISAVRGRKAWAGGYVNGHGVRRQSQGLTCVTRMPSSSFTDCSMNSMLCSLRPSTTSSMLVHLLDSRAEGSACGWPCIPAKPCHHIMNAGLTYQEGEVVGSGVQLLRSFQGLSSDEVNRNCTMGSMEPMWARQIRMRA